MVFIVLLQCRGAGIYRRWELVSWRSELLVSHWTSRQYERAQTCVSSSGYPAALDTHPFKGIDSHNRESLCHCIPLVSTIEVQSDVWQCYNLCIKIYFIPLHAVYFETGENCSSLHIKLLINTQVDGAVFTHNIHSDVKAAKLLGHRCTRQGYKSHI